MFFAFRYCLFVCAGSLCGTRCALCIAYCLLLHTSTFSFLSCAPRFASCAVCLLHFGCLSLFIVERRFCFALVQLFFGFVFPTFVFALSMFCSCTALMFNSFLLALRCFILLVCFYFWLFMRLEVTFSYCVWHSCFVVCFLLDLHLNFFCCLLFCLRLRFRRAFRFSLHFVLEWEHVCYCDAHELVWFF